ncbi:MAG TPA: PQQ-binding-like beta-propeller repeat protein [Abditibacteriaceae bacterium]
MSVLTPQSPHQPEKPGSSRKSRRSKEAEGLIRPTEGQGPAYDPFGIYGTRSAQRVVAARRRRWVQQLAVTLGVLALVAAIISLIWVPRVRTINGTRLGLVLAPAAAPVAAQDSGGAVLLVPGDDGALLRFDPQKSSAVSCLDTAFPLRASPLVRGAVAFVPSENGVLTALDWRQGKILWQRATGAALTTRPAFVEWKTVTKQVVTPETTPATVSSAENADNEKTTPDASSSPRTVVVTKTQKLVIIGNDGGLVAGLDAGTGKIIWLRRVSAPVGNGIVAAPGGPHFNAPRVCVPLLQSAGSPGGLWCLDARNGAIIWRYPSDNRTPSAQVAPPALDIEGGRVFCGDDSGALACLDLKSGRKIWKKFALPHNPQDNELALLRGEPLFRRYAFGALVVVGSNDGLVRAFDADNGALLWEFNAGAPVRARPLPLTQEQTDSPARELLLIGCDASFLPVLDPQNGRPICKLRASQAAPFGVVSVGEQLCTVTSAGVVEQFEF